MGAGIALPAAANLRIKPKIIAKSKFERGPEAATFAEPNFLSLILKGFIGTGLAHPKIIPELNNTSIKGTNTDPNGSKCLIGLKLNLPAFFAVGSPKT